MSEAVGATEVINSNACLKFDLNTDSLIETLAKFAQLHDSKKIIIDKPRELIPEIKNIANHCDDLISVITR